MIHGTLGITVTVAGHSHVQINQETKMVEVIAGEDNFETEIVTEVFDNKEYQVIQIFF